MQRLEVSGAVHVYIYIYMSLGGKGLNLRHNVTSEKIEDINCVCTLPSNVALPHFNLTSSTPVTGNSYTKETLVLSTLNTTKLS
jgi:hypothetical protein